MSLGISPGRYRRGEFVYTCMCGREGEIEWMTEHLKLAHGLTEAREREETLRTLPKRKEFANIREVGGESISPPEIQPSRLGYKKVIRLKWGKWYSRSDLDKILKSARVMNQENQREMEKLEEEEQELKRRRTKLESEMVDDSVSGYSTLERGDADFVRADPIGNFLEYKKGDRIAKTVDEEGRPIYE